jgi:hypothetical protein
MQPDGAPDEGFSPMRVRQTWVPMSWLAVEVITATQHAPIAAVTNAPGCHLCRWQGRAGVLASMCPRQNQMGPVSAAVSRTQAAPHLHRQALSMSVHARSDASQLWFWPSASGCADSRYVKQSSRPSAGSLHSQRLWEQLRRACSTASSKRQANKPVSYMFFYA